MAFFILFVLLPWVTTQFPSSENISLFGDAFLNEDMSSITLTKEKSCTGPPFLPPSTAALSGVGRAFYVNPVRFRDVSANYTASFSSTFSFTITTGPSCPFGDGLAFLITSNKGSVSDGYMGLPEETEAQDSYFAVVFDTSFNPNIEDASANNLIGINVNSLKSLASVNFNLITAGNEFAVWIEYNDLEKTIRVWIGYLEHVKPQNPVLVLHADLANHFTEWMHVGFSASNGKGSSTYTIKNWRFGTYTLPNSMSSKFQKVDDRADGGQGVTLVKILAIIVGFVLLLMVYGLRQNRALPPRLHDYRIYGREGRAVLHLLEQPRQAVAPVVIPAPPAPDLPAPPAPDQLPHPAPPALLPAPPTPEPDHQAAAQEPLHQQFPVDNGDWAHQYETDDNLRNNPFFGSLYDRY